MACSCLVQGQTITVNDSLFAAYLNGVAPNAMSGNDLDTVKAADSVFIETFNMSSLGLNDINEVIHFNKLDTLLASNNMLDSMGNIKKLTSLDYIDVSNNQLRYLPDVRNINVMKHYDCSNNLATEVPWMNSIDTVLRYIDVSNNNIESLYDHTNFINLTYMNVANNRLTFKWLLRSVNHPTFGAVFTYAPQQDWVVPSGDTLSVGQDFVFDMDLYHDDTVTSNTYTWYKDSIPFRVTSYDTIVVKNVQPSHSGTWHVEVTSSHPSLSLLTLRSTNFQLQVNNCIDASGLVVNVSETGCNRLADVTIDTSTIMGNGPFTLELIHLNLYDTTTSISGDYDEIKIGSYDLRIIDSSSCEVTVNSAVNIAAPNKCDFLITPNGDGDKDSFGIENTGEIKIFSRTGALITSFQAPGNWDGKGTDGRLIAPGYYVMYLDNKFFANISLLY